MTSKHPFSCSINSMIRDEDNNIVNNKNNIFFVLRIVFVNFLIEHCNSFEAFENVKITVIRITNFIERLYENSKAKN